MTDLLVIGAGLTGLFAACAAADAGLRVRVIAKGMGATHLHAGTIDLLGYLPGRSGPVANWARAVGELPETHPYRLLGVECIGRALGHFQQLAASAGLPYGQAGEGPSPPSATRPGGENQLLFSPVGAVRPVCLAPEAQQAGNAVDERPLAIAELEGIPDFFASLIAENLQRQGHRVRSLAIPVTALTKRRSSTPLQLARLLDQPWAQERLARLLAEAADPDERLGVPAVLGLKRHTHFFAQLQKASAGGSIFEIPTLPPSVPGMRLDAALRARLTALGVQVHTGMEVCGVETEGRQVLSVQTETGSRPLVHRARGFLLATGGILGGGIRGERSGDLVETVFDLPLSAPRTRAGWLRRHFLDGKGHPVFQAGVPVDDGFRPLDGGGEPVFENVWAAGAVLAHADPIRERSREGIAIATGYAAARSIAAGAVGSS